MKQRVRVRWALLGSAFLMLSAPLAADGPPYRVADLRTLPSASGTFWGDLIQLPGAALLLGGLPGTGAEPWLTDGTAGGTMLLRDLAPGRLDSAYVNLGSAGGFAFFSAWTPATGVEPWRSDGTAGGTIQLADSCPGRAGSFPEPLGVLSDVLLFVAWDPAHGAQVWRSDGSVAGTWRVSDLAGGVCGWTTRTSFRHAALDGRVYFGGDDGEHGCELFATDGSPAGTRLVADLVAGPGSSVPERPWAAFGRIYFSAWDPLHGRELWVSDGTAIGTRLVADLVPGEEDSWPEPMGAVGGGFAFDVSVAGIYNRPYWTDGVTGATPLADSSVNFASSSLEYGGRLVFFASDNLHGREPWTTDGTPEGTVMLADLHPGADSSIWGSTMAVGALGVYFIAWDVNWDGALWRTDGKPGGSMMRVGATASAESIEGFAEVGGLQVFDFEWWEYCGPHEECEYWESWVSDGTEEGTRRLWPEPVESSAADPGELTASPGGLDFVASSDLQSPAGWSQLAFRTDGSEAGTEALRTESGETVASYEMAGPLPGGAVLLDGRTETVPWALWRADGDRLTMIHGGALRSGAPASGDPGRLTQVGALVYFAGYDAATAVEPWRSDGTAEGTFLLSDVNPGPGYSYPANFTAVAGGVWFDAENETEGREPWETDGTPSGTFVHDLTPGPDGTLSNEFSSEIAPLDPDTDALVLRSNDELLAHPSGADGVIHLKTFSENLRSLWEEPVLTPSVGRVFFVDADAESNCELWATDGTVEGTTRVAPIGYGWDFDWWWDPCPPRPTAFAGGLWFAACDAEAGCELWTSDGTEAGTHRFADLEPGPASLLPTNLTPIGGRLYFSGCTEAEGCEPWVSDGTVAGTQRLGDIAPGMFSSEPYGFTLSACHVYFGADDGTGAELWAVTTGVFCDGFETGDTSRWSETGP